MSATRSNVSRLKQIKTILDAEAHFLDAFKSKRSVGEILPYEGALKRLNKRYDILMEEEGQTKTLPEQERIARSDKIQATCIILLDDIKAQINEMKGKFNDIAELQEALLHLNSLFDESANNSNNNSRNTSRKSSLANLNIYNKPADVSENKFSEESVSEDFKKILDKNIASGAIKQLINQYSTSPILTVFILRKMIANYILLAKKFINVKDDKEIDILEATAADVKNWHKKHRLTAVKVLFDQLTQIQQDLKKSSSASFATVSDALTTMLASFENALNLINLQESNKFGRGLEQTYFGQLTRYMKLSDKVSITEIFIKYNEDKPALETMLANVQKNTVKPK